MNAKNAAPLIVTLPAIAAAAPPLIIGGAIFIGFVYFCEWLISEDDKNKKPESVPASFPPAPAALSRPAVVIPSVSGGNSAQNPSIPPNSGGKPNVMPAPSVSEFVIVRTNSAPVPPKNPIPPSPSFIPAMKIASQVPLPPPIKKKFVTRNDLATIFHRGAHALTRTAAVAALKKIGFGKTAAYAALTPDGRFSAWLRFAPDGIITWTE